MIITHSLYHPSVILSNDNSDWTYIPILKNAHTFGTHFFKHLDNFVENDKNFRNKKHIVFLRDPLQRWYSATMQWFKSQGVDENYIIDPMTLKLIFSAIALDSHGDLQIKYLNGLSVSKCVFFNIDEGYPRFMIHLKHFIENRMFKEMPTQNIPDYNSSENDPVKQNIKAQLKLAISNNPKYISNIRHHYTADYKLIQTIKFYEKH